MKDAQQNQGVVEPKLCERNTGEQVDIKTFLTSLKFGEEWVVAWDEGGHELVVGELTTHCVGRRWV